MTIYEKIKEQISDAYYQQNYANDGQRFVAWYLINIHKRDRNEARDDITDGLDDKQIDAIFIDEDKALIYIIQGKFIANGSLDSEPLMEVLASWIQIQDPQKLQTNANQRLQRKLPEVSQALEEDYEVCFELITTVGLTQAAADNLEAFQVKLSEISEKCDFYATISMVDNIEIERRFDIALGEDNPVLNYQFDLTGYKFMHEQIANTEVIIAAIPLKACINIPGIKNGLLFRKNVRQSLGSSNAINKAIRHTILGDKHKDFFFFHNGITAICNQMQLNGNILDLRGLNVVNGCQSLNTILNCSETVRKLDDTFVLFRFYEIPQIERADRITINTNSQSAVKARDLRSNDKRVINLKHAYEQKYPNGYFITKRGEEPLAEKDKNYVIDLSDLGKYLISWHSQRPNIAYGETKIFDKYFEILFKRDYKPENIYALNVWMKEVMKSWVDSNPENFNQSLLAMKAYGPYHQLYGVSMCFAYINNMNDRVPSPYKSLMKAQQNGMMRDIVKVSGSCLNMALQAAAIEPQPQNKVFSPQNWIKAKASLSGINSAINQYFAMLPMMPGGQEIKEKFVTAIMLDPGDFEYRWAAD